MKLQKLITMGLLSTAFALTGAGGTAVLHADAAVNPNQTKMLAENKGQIFQYKTAAEIKAEQENSANPFGLVYHGAITENQQGKVNIHPVSYMSQGIKISANIYTPAGWSNKDKNKYAAVVVAHPNGGVKEQVSGLFAQKLAENGYVAIAFDAAYQGHSGGEPRNMDMPARRVEDIRRAADIVSQFPGVDENRLAALGICGGGGYTFKTVQGDKRFKAAATLSMFNSGQVRRNGFLDSQTDTIQQRLADASDASNARAAEARGENIPYTVGFEGTTPEQAAQ